MGLEASCDCLGPRGVPRTDDAGSWSSAALDGPAWALRAALREGVADCELRVRLPDGVDIANTIWV